MSRRSPREAIELRTIADRVEIASGVWMPRLGIGTWRAHGEEVKREIRIALEAGYRLIDTSANYLNEREIGEELARANVQREELFVTTKLEEPDQGYASTFRALDESLRRLRLDYVDLYLIHWPVPSQTEATWRALEELVAQGKTRAIGVSNFEPHHLEQLVGTATMRPAVNQVELHPLHQRTELQRYCRERGITIEAWGPVVRGHASEVRELAEIGRRHGKTPAQVSIRWILQRDIATIPKSVHEGRIRENADVFDFELEPDEMAMIDSLDRGTHARL